MSLTSLMPEQQALINLLLSCATNAEHLSRVLQSAIYLRNHEGGDIDLIFCVILLMEKDQSYILTLLQDIEYYSSQKIKRILALISCFATKKEKPLLREYCIVSDALLLNTGRVVVEKEMYTLTGKSLIKERRSVSRLFARREKTTLKQA